MEELEGRAPRLVVVAEEEDVAAGVDQQLDVVVALDHLVSGVKCQVSGVWCKESGVRSLVSGIRCQVSQSTLNWSFLGRKLSMYSLMSGYVSRIEFLANNITLPVLHNQPSPKFFCLHLSIHIHMMRHDETSTYLIPFCTEDLSWVTPDTFSFSSNFLNILSLKEDLTT